MTDKVTVGRYLVERWLPIQKTRLRASTYDAYRRNIDLHVLPGLGRQALDKLTAEDVDVFYAKLLTDGRKNTKGDITGLAPKTVRNIHVMLNKALSDAVRKGAVVRNVVALADAPSLKAQKCLDIKACDAVQLRTFLDAIRSHRLHPAFHLSSHTGMRRGEILGLRWCDLDLDAGRVSVRQALVSIAYDVQLSDVKKAWRIERAEVDRASPGARHHIDGFRGRGQTTPRPRPACRGARVGRCTTSGTRMPPCC